MTYYTKMITCASMKAEYDNLDVATPELEPETKAKLSVRLAFLNPTEKTDLNLAAHYSLGGELDIVVAVLPFDHPMKDIFTPRGAAKDQRIVEYVRNHLEKQRLQQEISRLEAPRF